MYSNRVFITTDQGATWTSGPDLGSDVRSISQVSKETVLAVDRQGDINRSTDGGATWTVIKRVAGEPRSIFALYGATLWGAGSANLLFAAHPPAQFGDFNGTTNTFTNGSSTFGACVRTATGVVSTPWTPAVGAICDTSVATSWHGVPVAPVVIARTANSVIGEVHLQFAARRAPEQAPGKYVAPLRFTVTAP